MFKSEAPTEDQTADLRSKRANKVVRSAGLKKAKLAKAKAAAEEAPQAVEVEEAEDVVETVQVGEDALPGKASIMVKTFGCSHNISDSEYMAGLLEEYGFTLVDKVEDADACLINSCTVKNPS